MMVNYDYMKCLILLSFVIVFLLPNMGFSQPSANSTVEGGQEVKLISPVMQKISDKGTYLVSIKS